MKNKLSIIFSFLYLTGFSQLAPQENFSDKISLIDQKYSATLSKNIQSYNGDNYDLKYHRFKWNIDPDTNFISGEVTSYFKITKSSVSEISFDLSSVLTVDSVKYHSSKLSFNLSSDDALKIDFTTPLNLNQFDSLTVYYHGTPVGNGFGSFVKDTHDTVNHIPIIWTLSEPYGAKEWWPCKNNLSDKIDSIDVYITSPEKYRAASNGMLVSETTENGFKTAHWKHRYPIAAYLIGIAVTNYDTFSVYSHHGNDSLQILNYVYPENAEKFKTDVKQVIPSMQLYDSLFIPYPFSKERYGHAQFGWRGGQEHQTMTFIFEFSHELMAHELAHQWVGDMITCGNWHDIWLNEGFATYWTGLTYEYLFNGYYWNIWKQAQIRNITKYTDGSVYCNDTTNFSRVFDGRLTYAKGAMILNTLRWVIGDSAFFAGMKNYLTDVKLSYAYACSEDFITHIETASGKNLTSFFNEWLYGEGYPIYTVQCLFSPVSTNMQICINQSQSNSSVSFFEMPVPIQFKDATHDTIVVFDNTYAGQLYTLDLGFRPDTVIFDPDAWIISAQDTVILRVQGYPVTEKFQIFPNPVKDFINIDFSGNQLQRIELLDIKGKLIYSDNQISSSLSKIKIDVSAFADGIYFLKTVFDNSTVVSKIVKVK